MKKQEAAAPVNVVADGDRVIKANVKDIKASPFQARRHFDPVQIEELAASIRERGLIQPLVVRKVDGQYELIAGERRLRAVTSLGMTTVKVVVHEASDQEVAELARELMIAGKDVVYDEIMDAVSDFDMVNAKLAAILDQLAREDL